jgi:hypothetical protein
MSLLLAHDCWAELKRYISNVDHADAADSLVHLLIDNDYDAGEIRAAFKNDSDVKSALSAYLVENEPDDDIEDEYEDDDDDDDDNNQWEN